MELFPKHCSRLMEISPDKNSFIDLIDELCYVPENTLTKINK